MMAAAASETPVSSAQGNSAPPAAYYVVPALRNRNQGGDPGLDRNRSSAEKSQNATPHVKRYGQGPSSRDSSGHYGNANSPDRGYQGGSSRYRPGGSQRYYGNERQGSGYNRRKMVDNDPNFRGSGSGKDSASFSRGKFNRYGDGAPSQSRGPSEQRYPGVGSWAARAGRGHVPENFAEVFNDPDGRVSAGINFQSYDSIPVEVSGPRSEGIKPFVSFDDPEIVHPQLTDNIGKLDYKNPTPVQKYSIPVIYQGRDLMACAQTGSGKTAAFLLPIISRMLSTGPPEGTESRRMRYSSFCPAFPVALVLSPTRELAVQIFKESRKFAFETGILTHVVYGGSPFREQSRSIQRHGTDICVATPGRLLELIDRGNISLEFVTYLVLDEADRMLDMGFTPQITSIVNESGMPKSAEGRQTIMFSATFPVQIQRLAAQFLRESIFLTVGRIGSTNEFITQSFVYANETNKPQQLIRVLRESTSALTLIFVETKRKADIITVFLVKSGFDTVCLHGDKTQIERERALSDFRSGRCPLLVATDVAARGLDINNVDLVINCDLPPRIEDYVHRIGRTGRAGNHGNATSFVNEQNRPILRDLLSLLEESQQQVQPWFYELVKSCSSAYSNFQQKSYHGFSSSNANHSSTSYRKPSQRGSYHTYDAAPNHAQRSRRPQYEDEEDGW